MVVKPFRMIIYSDESGNEPFTQWITMLDRTIRARILSRLDRVEQGNHGDHKALGDGLHELRFTFGAGYRIYFGMVGDALIILLNGGSKASQTKDIKRAKVCWENYLERQNNERI